MPASAQEIESQIATAEAELPKHFPLEGEFRWHDATPIARVRVRRQTVASSDGTIRISGPTPERDTTTVVLDSDLAQVSAIRLEALTDPQLPKQGPGRAPNGNFVLTEIRVEAAPRDPPAEAQPIALASATADAAQSGFAPEQALDADPQTGWAIQGPEPWNVPRTAIFRLSQPWTGVGQTRWTIRLEQQYGGGHTLGRFRIRLRRAPARRSSRGRAARGSFESSIQRLAGGRISAHVRWTLLKPLSAHSDVPTLTVLPDDSVLASGDQTKSDTYRISLATAMPKVTALRVEALPDDRLPQRGPGRIAYEGPFGDFFLSEVAVRAGPTETGPQRGEPFVRQWRQYRGGGDRRRPADRLVDRRRPRPGSHRGFHAGAAAGRRQHDRLDLLFESDYSAGLGRFRVWATDDPRPPIAQSLPSDVEAAVARERGRSNAGQRARLMAHFLSISPELAPTGRGRQTSRTVASLSHDARDDRAPAGEPARTNIHKRGEFLQTTDAVEPGLPGMFAPCRPTARTTGWRSPGFWSARAIRWSAG